MRTVKVEKSSKSPAYHEGVTVAGLDFRFGAKRTVKEHEYQKLEKQLPALEELGYKVEISGKGEESVETASADDSEAPASDPKGTVKSRGR